MDFQYKRINIYYTDKGEGLSVVLLHGFLENSAMWNHFIPTLSQKNRIVCIDLLGHGNTGCLGYIHTMEDMAGAVAALLNHLKISSSIFIGHSMGGYVALAFAEKKPKNVIGLCLMNSTALADTEEKRLNRDRGILAVKQNHRTFIRMAITNLFTPENRTIFADKIEALIFEAFQTPLQGVIAALEGMKIRKSQLETLKKGHYKKWMVIGKNDPALDYVSLIEQSKYADIHVVEFPDGHMSYIENESNLLHTILRFIEK